jgi:hypothetical protein
MYSMQWAMDYLYEASYGTAIRYAAEKRNLAESIAELREIANGHDDILAEAAGITAGSWYASPATHVGRELIAADMLIFSYLLVVAAVAVLVALVLWIGARERQSPRRLISWKAATCSRAPSNRPRQGRRVNPNSGQHDRVASADGPAIDNRGVDADVHSIVLSGRP